MNAHELEQRFRRLFATEYSHLLAYALRRASDPADAQDIVAETFLVAWRRISEAPADAEARPWLYAIAARTIANQRRGRRRLHALRDRLRAWHPRAGESALASRDEWETVLAALARLADHEQEVLRLVAWEGLSNRELAAALGCSENAAAIRLHRARRKLTAELAKEASPSGHLEVELHPRR
jgi:RNA polymerase sigma factor (sigma-70 family)